MEGNPDCRHDMLRDGPVMEVREEIITDNGQPFVRLIDNDLVDTRLEIENGVAAGHDENVGSLAASHRIVSGPADNSVFAAPADDAVIGGRPDEKISFLSTHDPHVYLHDAG